MYTYFGDPEICLRAARAGWEKWFVPESQVVHLGGATTGVTGKQTPNRRPAYWFQARRRFFLKNYGALYTLLIDATFILGHSIWCVRRWIMRIPDNGPRYLMLDSIRHSVFCAGFKVPVVENPAMRAQKANHTVSEG